MMKSMKWAEKLTLRLGTKVLLTTTGARTGKSREAVLGWFPEGDRTDSGYVIASNGGQAIHPAWAYNLAKNPAQATIDLGEGKMFVDVQMLTGDERESVWNHVVERAPTYGKYLDKTDRQIPIFRLTRV
jgi:deazaflavin-dependent oxidoreductase (nitroreductase family)